MPARLYIAAYRTWPAIFASISPYSPPPPTWLLDLADAERRAAAAALPRCGAPVVKLEESSDNELYRPTPPRFGDAGQGSSRQAPPPQDDGDSSDDDGDYTRFYRHFGM
jgi:hypothetical protein